jgi:NAD(P)-dependent dehydrogenase (short-subunit alcohol dehydrogenase family)
MAAIKTFHEKSCLVTGAASGIGRATALALGADGARLVLTDINADGLLDAVEEIRAAGGVVLHAEAFDLTDLERVRAFADAVHAEHGSMDVVMNVAGISTWGAVEELEHHHWQKMVDVDLMGPIHVIEAFVPAMVHAGRGGHLVNVSSAAGLLGLPWHAAYSAAKFGLRGVSEVLRFDLRRHGIGVSLVCPGAVATPLVGTVEIVGIDRDHPAARAMSGHFLRHAASPEQVAQAILTGVRRGRYLVFTSRDIRAAHLLQRWCPPVYALVMRRLNDRMFRIAERARPAERPLAGTRA